MTDAEVERLMAASRKSSRYGYRDATQIGVLPCANPRRGALGAANMYANGHVRVCFRQIEKNRHERFTHSHKLGNISKRGDRYLRSLFTTGALAVICYAKIHGTKHRPWLTALLTRRPTKVAAIALANKIARIAWAMMAKGER